MSAFDATTWPQQIDFALDNVANHGVGRDYADDGLSGNWDTANIYRH